VHRQKYKHTKKSATRTVVVVPQNPAMAAACTVPTTSELPTAAAPHLGRRAEGGGGAFVVGVDGVVVGVVGGALRDVAVAVVEMAVGRKLRRG
jgi:hypothetical protein